MRLFVAIRFGNSIGEIQGQIDRSLAGFTFPKEFHLTLKFLGEVDSAEQIRERLSSIEFNPFEVELGDIGVFPSPSKISVIWAGVKNPEEVNALQKSIDIALQDLSPADAGFHPHITLARVKFVKDKEKLKENLKNICVGKEKFAINEFILYRSTLKPEGPVYDVVERYKAK